LHTAMMYVLELRGWCANGHSMATSLRLLVPCPWSVFRRGCASARPFRRRSLGY
ncbi:hypothetical protein ElyMa_006272000, partial [Elysia marginata]